MPHTKDQMQRFIFAETDIRGEVVSLEEAYQTVTEQNPAPRAVQHLLGEFLAAASLLSSTLKFDGIITLQARGDGPLSLIMAEGDHHKGLRGIANPDPEADFSELENATMQELLGKSVLAITIDPDKGQRYQGVVPLEEETLAACLEHYFKQSEQLDTRFWIAVNEQRVSALMLQALPQQKTDSKEQWETVTALAGTVTPQELLELEHKTLLYRLFNEHEVRLFDSLPIRFSCSCSRARCAHTLASLGPEDVAEMIEEQGKVSIDCQFCKQHYSFKMSDMAEIFPDQASTLH